MGYDATENQELAMIKNFLGRYKGLIIGLLLFFVLALVGTNFWYSKRYNTATRASHIFQEMVFAELQQDAKSAVAKGSQLMTEYSNSPYAQFAGLLLAKIAVAEGDLNKAAEKLRWVAARKSDKDIARHLATVRLAAVLQQQGKLDEALNLVKSDPDKAFISLYAQARGDIYVALGDIEAAKTAYKIAQQSLPQGVQSPLLQMKLLDLGVSDEV